MSIIWHLEGNRKRWVLLILRFWKVPRTLAIPSLWDLLRPFFHAIPTWLWLFGTSCTSCAHRFMRQPPRHGRFRRFQVANPRSLNSWNSIKNVEPAAQNGKKTPRNPKKEGLRKSFGGLGSTWGIFTSLEASLASLGSVRGDLGPPGANKSSPLGRPWGPQNDTQTVPKTFKIKAKSQHLKIAFQDDLGPVLGRSWVVLGALLKPRKRSKHYACRRFVKDHFLNDKTIQRRFWHQL